MADGSGRRGRWTQGRGDQRLADRVAPPCRREDRARTRSWTRIVRSRSTWSQLSSGPVLADGRFARPHAQLVSCESCEPRVARLLEPLEEGAAQSAAMVSRVSWSVACHGQSSVTVFDRIRSARSCRLRPKGRPLASVGSLVSVTGLVIAAGPDSATSLVLRDVFWQAIADAVDRTRRSSHLARTAPPSLPPRPPEREVVFFPRGGPAEKEATWS